MESHQVTGSAGARLHVVETGIAHGRPVLFIHGLSQCSLAWARQLESDLAEDHRLVALDLRGHGESDKPAEGYDDSRLWAEDVDAVMRRLDLDRPVLCGWSYGALVIFDYIRHYGADDIGGVHLVAPVSKLGSEAALSAIAPAFLDLAPGLFATEVGESVRAVETLVRMCCIIPPTFAERFLMLGYNLCVPPAVRQAMLSRAVDNDDLLGRLQRPTLITRGGEDPIITRPSVERLAAAIRGAELHNMPGAGHAPFWDEAPAFNRRLRQFADRCAS